MANIFCRKKIFFNEIIKIQNVADELLKKIKKKYKNKNTKYKRFF